MTKRKSIQIFLLMIFSGTFLYQCTAPGEAGYKIQLNRRYSILPGAEMP